MPGCQHKIVEGGRAGAPWVLRGQAVCSVALIALLPKQIGIAGSSAAIFFGAMVT